MHAAPNKPANKKAEIVRTIKQLDNSYDSDFPVCAGMEPATVDRGEPASPAVLPPTDPAADTQGVELKCATINARTGRVCDRVAAPAANIGEPHFGWIAHSGAGELFKIDLTLGGKG